MRKAHPARVPEYLLHIIEAIDRATGYVAGMDATAFEQDTRTQDAVIRALEIAGGAASRARVAGPPLHATAREIPWHVMYGMRNRIVHDYFEVDLDVVWQTIQRDLPELRPRIVQLLARIS